MVTELQSYGVEIDLSPSVSFFVHIFHENEKYQYQKGKTENALNNSVTP